MKSKYLLCGFALACALIAPALAADAKPHQGIVCIPIQNIRNTPAVDDRTILLELYGNKYKRIDLASYCPDLTFKGFAYDTSINQLCSSDALHVNETAGAVCMIKDIVDVTPDEAKELRSKAK